MNVIVSHNIPMASYLFHSILIAVFLATPVLNQPTRVPKAICTNGLTPGKHIEGPYIFSGNSSVKSGEGIYITLTGGDFTTYLLDVEDAKANPVGVIEMADVYKPYNIRNVSPATTYADIRKTPIKSMEFKWLSPVKYKGVVKFFARVFTFDNDNNLLLCAVTKNVTVE